MIHRLMFLAFCLATALPVVAKDTPEAQNYVEANAFYDPETLSITICSEFEPHLRNLFANN